MTDPTNPTPQYAELCERLRATKTQTRIIHSSLGFSYADESTTREAPINPDGPEAATALQSLQAENERLRSALEGMVNHYTRLVNSGDAGNWDPETEEEVIAARAALSPEYAGGGNG